MRSSCNQKSGRSDERAKQFIAETKPFDLLMATAAERYDPLLSGNKDVSQSPEQAARFGPKTPYNCRAKAGDKGIRLRRCGLCDKL